MSSVACASKRRSAVALAALVCCAAPLTAAAQPARAQAATPAQSEPLVARVTLNSVLKGDFFVFRTAGGDFLVKREDLKTMGLRDPGGAQVQMDGEAHVSLRSMPGISFAFDLGKAELAITADPQLLPRQVFEQNEMAQRRGIVPRDDSAFLNYALSYANGSTFAQTRLGLTLEGGVRWGDNLFLADGATLDRPDGSRKFVRLMSNVTRDDREKLQRIVAGDFFSPARDFSIGANMGGLSFSKLYDINPYLVHYPTQTIRGNVALPSDLELYVDGQRVRVERLSPGEFELEDVTGYRGARSVQLVLRDSFGRVQQLNYAFYVTDQPLRRGFHEYSYNLGALRRHFGRMSNDYGQPAYSMFHRYGFTDALTLGLRAEGTRELFNGGPSATLVLGPAGVLNLALARSSIAGRQGNAASVAYSYQGTRWSAGLLARRDWGEFAVLGEPVSVSNRKRELGANVSLHMGERGSLSLAHATLGVYPGRVAAPPSATQPFAVTTLLPRRETSLTYSVPLISGKASLRATVRHVKDPAGSRNELFLGVLYFPDRDHMLNASVRADTDRARAESVQYTRHQPFGEGLGYSVSADRFSQPGSTSTQLRSNAQYNASAFLVRGELNAIRQRGETDHEQRLTVAGGIGYLADRVFLSRPIVDSFAVVKVGEVPGVEVSLNGLPVGRTNARGEIVIPSLHAFYDNEVSIKPSDVPIEYAVDALKLKISPALRSGALVSFNATRIQAISGKLKYVSGGTLLPLENQVVAFTVGDKRHNFRTARGGEFYLENVKPGSYAAEATTPQGRCRFELTIPTSSETFLELPDVVCRPAR